MLISKKYILLLIAITVGLNNIVIGYKILDIGIDRLIQIAIFFMLFRHFIKDLEDHNLKIVQSFIGVLFVLIIAKYLSLLLQGEDIHFNVIVRGSIRVLMYGIFIYLAYYLFKRDLNKLNIILAIFLLAFLLAFFQNPLTPLTEVAQHVRLGYFAENMQPKDLEIYGAFLDDINRDFMRVSGPYGQVITLSYSLVVASILTVYMYVRTNNYIYLFMEFFIFIVSIMTLTRSAVLAISIMLIYIFKFNKYILFFLMLSTLLIYTYYLDALGGLSQFSRVVESDKSSEGKLFLILTGALAVLLNPFGVSPQNYLEVKQWMFAIYHNKDILHYSSHNGLVNLGFEYTVLVYIPFVALSVYLVKRAKILSKNEKSFWSFAIFSYFIQQSFHNNGIFYVEFNILIVLALFLADLNRSGNVTYKKSKVIYGNINCR